MIKSGIQHTHPLLSIHPPLLHIAPPLSISLSHLIPTRPRMARVRRQRAARSGRRMRGPPITWPESRRSQTKRPMATTCNWPISAMGSPDLDHMYRLRQPAHRRRRCVNAGRFASVKSRLDISSATIRRCVASAAKWATHLEIASERSLRRAIETRRSIHGAGKRRSTRIAVRASSPAPAKGFRPP